MNSMKVMISLVLPVLLMVAAGIVKKITRGTGWKVADFYLGVEMAFTCVCSGILLLLDILKPCVSGLPLPAASTGPLVRACAFTGASFVVFLVVMALHQDHGTDEHGNEKKPDSPQKFWLGCVANGAGIVTLFAFLLWVKGLKWRPIPIGPS
jgi:hypothetical protein